MKRILIFLLFPALLISCGDFDLKMVVSDFPSTLVFDSVQVNRIEKYDRTGMIESDIDISTYSPGIGWKVDSLVIPDRKHGLAYSSAGETFAGQFLKIDSLDIGIGFGKLKTVPCILPEYILYADITEAGHIRTVEDADTIRAHLTREYSEEGDYLILPLYAVQVLTPNPYVFGGYTSYRVDGLNQVDVEEWYPYLEEDEVLLLIRYTLLYQMKNE